MKSARCANQFWFECLRYSCLSFCLQDKVLGHTACTIKVIRSWSTTVDKRLSAAWLQNQNLWERFGCFIYLFIYFWCPSPAEVIKTCWEWGQQWRWAGGQWQVFTGKRGQLWPLLNVNVMAFLCRRCFNRTRILREAWPSEPCWITKQRCVRVFTYMGRVSRIEAVRFSAVF